MKLRYWFYIESYVHISIKREHLLFYNPYTGKIIEYTAKPEILKLAKRLQSPVNLQVIPLKEMELNRPEIREFVNTMRKYFLGDIIDTAHSEGRPVQMPPIVKIQKDVKYLKEDKLRSIGEDIMDYLSDIWIYINDRCSQDCAICTQGYRQFPCCTSTKRGNHELDIERLRDFFEEVKNCSLNINILGGNIFAYSQLDHLLRLLISHQHRKVFYLHYLNVVVNSSQLKRLVGCRGLVKIPVTFPVNEEKLKMALEMSAEVGLKTALHFVIRDEGEFEKADALASVLPIENPEFNVFYDGTNLDFFRENIFIDREEIENVKPSLKDIYARRAINPLNFGHLSILPTSRVYANVNHPSLDILGRHSIGDIVFKEMNEGKSWRSIRKNVLPCKQCIFNALCPPISNYNIVIGKNNLCHIR